MRQASSTNTMSALIFSRDALESQDSLPFPPEPKLVARAYNEQYGKDLRHIANGLWTYWKHKKPHETSVTYVYHFSPCAYKYKDEWMKPYLEKLLGTKEEALERYKYQFEEAFRGFRLVGIKELGDWDYNVTFEISEVKHLNTVHNE